MEFPARHIERHQQFTILQDELPVRYAALQMQYEALHREMIDYKTKSNYWEAQFNKFNMNACWDLKPAAIAASLLDQHTTLLNTCSVRDCKAAA